ncbi:MAG TPA: hypothetical protein DD727_00915 [Clostridiales bacterium]|nr:hypothetical protein [Clostridiales bacterium]
MDSGSKLRIGTRTVVVLGLMIGLNVVLTRILRLELFGSTVRLSFNFLPIVVTSYIFGPYVGALTAAAADVVGYFLFPTGGAFFPGFTISAALYGLAYGFFFHKRPVTLVRSLLAFSVPGILITIFLNTYWLTLLQKVTYLAILPGRVMQFSLLLPVQVVSMLALGKYLEKWRQEFSLSSGQA